VLLAYFRRTPVEKSISIEVPMHTVIKCSPVQGGGWMESTHSLLPNEVGTLSRFDSDEAITNLASQPIWDDHIKLSQF